MHALGEGTPCVFNQRRGDVWRQLGGHRKRAAQRIASAGQAGYIGASAHAAALAATLASIEVGIGPNEETASRAERVWQSEWIARHVIAPSSV